MRNKGCFLVMIGAALFCSCVTSENAYGRVVDYYVGDSLKHEAALFLEQHAKYHYGIARDLVDSIGKKSKLSASMFKNDSLYKKYMENHLYHLNIGRPVMDVDVITEDYLKENIELAFDSWQKPWSRKVSFSDFCRYILPYRNGDEELNQWRKNLKQRYEHLIVDSFKETCSIKEIVEFLMRQIRRNVNYGILFGNMGKYFFTPNVTERLGKVECKACANYATLVMRACGIPCIMIDIHWRFTEAMHFSVLFPKTNCNPRAFRAAIGDGVQYMREQKDSMAVWRSWAYTYEVNEILLRMLKDKNISRDFVLPVTRKDITSQISRTFNFRCFVPDSLRSYRYIFLCRFNNWNWYPIREGEVYGDSVYFRGATICQLYRLGYFQKTKIQTFGDCFTVLGNGQLKKYDMTGEKVFFKIAYNCKSNETRLMRNITIYYWEKNRWTPVTVKASLWGFNEKTGEYKLLSDGVDRTFKPVFHLLQIELPMWTVFFGKELQRPIGFIAKNPKANEGYTMCF